MSQRLILTALKSARLNGVPLRVRKTEKKRRKTRGKGTKKGGGERGDGGRGAEKKTHFKE